MEYTRKRLKKVVASRNSSRFIGDRYVYSLQMLNIADAVLVFIDRQDSICTHLLVSDIRQLVLQPG
jgi:hypothetical protein